MLTTLERTAEDCSVSSVIRFPSGNANGTRQAVLRISEQDRRRYANCV